jgi:hypothetical protein
MHSSIAELPSVIHGIGGPGLTGGGVGVIWMRIASEK